jgi:site-specific DNA-cytosine methylase
VLDGEVSAAFAAVQGPHGLFMISGGVGRASLLNPTPRELERLNGFPDNWTDTGMPNGRRAFMMGNALVVGLIERVGHVLFVELAGGSTARANLTGIEAAAAS